MTGRQIMWTVAAIALITFLTRAVPFLLFRKRTPRFVVYLGSVLPCAVMGMLVVYCFKGVSPAVWPYGIPEAAAALFVAAAHKWKRNLLLSIGGGTALYMLLVQAVS
jgi:branched-subunit amino acid transport protein AzlD